MHGPVSINVNSRGLLRVGEGAVGHQDESEKHNTGGDSVRSALCLPARQDDVLPTPSSRCFPLQT